ncbi:MAG: helix-turn-helix domain-containing protein [Balneola sp.]
MGKKKRHSISEAISVLKCHPVEIMTVSEWAYYMGYSRSYFCRCFKKEFGISPKRKLKVFRLRLIRDELRKRPQAKCYEVAVNTGFNDDKSLYKYLVFHCQMNLTEFKSHVI